MPELPEIQALAERIDRDFAGTELARFVPLTFTALKTVSPPPEEAAGQALVFAGRRGKYLLLDFGRLTFVVHLMQGGRLRVDEKQAARPRNGIARWVFEDGRALLLTEAGTEHKAGVWAFADDPETLEPLASLGPEADRVTEHALAELLRTNSMRLHGFLRDQRILAGVGRRLANEVCHRAKLSPFAQTTKLKYAEAERLCEAMRACINESLAFERERDDMSSSAERPGNVHHREGEPCPVCGDTVRAVEYRSYTVNYCPTCQTDGKVLADNTTSKFLK
jgi:formamidopyrimidine-DNA glycosylase